MMGKNNIVHTKALERKILFIRGEAVLLDVDLANLYDVETRILIQAVKRNIERFPADFMFQLNQEEYSNLKSQNVISSSWGGRRRPPYAFTEHGVAMLASVLRSPIAISVSIEIVRAFVRLRKILSSHEELRRKILSLEKHYDGQFQVVFKAIQALITPPMPPKRKRIGFDTEYS